LAVIAAALMLPASASAVANHFAVATPSPVTAGTPFTVTVTARNPDNSIDAGYAGPVALTSSDPAAVLPTPLTLASGTGSGSATLNTPGCRRITASDGSISGSSPQIAVNGCDLIDSRTGDLTGGDPTQTGRLALDATPSQCGSTKSPALGAATGARAYDAYGYTNLTNAPICITVDLDPGASCAAAGIFNVSYMGGFVPTNPLTNYAGDPGALSPAGGTVVSYSFTVPSGASFTNVVHAFNAGGSCTGYFYSASSGKPYAFSRPSAVGTPAVGSVLGWETGTWAGTPSFSYQWRRCDAAGSNCVDIPGATAGTYAPVQEDVGSTLRIRVADTDGLGTSTADSLPTAVVTGAPPASPAPTSVSGQTAKKKKCKKRKHKASAAKKKCKKKKKG
jgi:hypothetical protein